MIYLFPFRDIGEDKSSEVGGKGASLVRLTRLRLPVPRGYILLASAFKDGRLIEEARQEVESLINTLSSSITYAIRSSALGEDGKEASFAGQFQTITNVPRERILDAINEVIKSKEENQVSIYEKKLSVTSSSMAVIIQEYVVASFSGVLFTTDIITGDKSIMKGNYVQGECEKLVSGVVNASEFTINAMKFSYMGSDELRRYAKKLYSYATKIVNAYDCAMDIEWAISNNKMYILQARPITTLMGFDRSSYQINASLSGNYLLTRTNVGEIFMHPVSPATFSLIEKIYTAIGFPHFVEIVEGQAYLNISIIISILVAFGVSKDKAIKLTSGIIGRIPEGIDIPVFKINKKPLITSIWGLITSPKEKYDIDEIASELYGLVKKTNSHINEATNNEELIRIWNEECTIVIKKGIQMIIKGVNTKDLFTTSKKIEKLAGEELASRLCSGGLGMIDSLRPLLMLEDVASGTITRDEYIKSCGHRSINEMEISLPYPYEDKRYIDNKIIEHKASGVNAHLMREKKNEDYSSALEEFSRKNPNKIRKLTRELTKLRNAHSSRESVRSNAIYLFVMIRQFYLKIGEINKLHDDIFMLYIDEALALIKGDTSCLVNISSRRQNYDSYLEYPTFPNIICGRFEPEVWIKDKGRRSDYYCHMTDIKSKNSDIKGFPGASGVVTGRVRILNNIDEANTLIKGEILVTNATNIAWTIVFPKASAIITDIGAPLSHSAIVAREFGIPAVVGCGNATTLLRTGDIVTVDGMKGTVVIHDNVGHAESLLSEPS